MLPWIILDGIALVLNLANMIRYVFVGYFIGLLPGVLFLALAVYLFIVVWSYRFRDILLRT